jgi:uncharacterized protein (UPF0276 family)
MADFPLQEVVEIHVAGIEYDRDLEGPWIAPTPPNDEVLHLAQWVAQRAPKLRAVTVDVFSPTMTAAQLEESMKRTRAAFSTASAAAS